MPLLKVDQHGPAFHVKLQGRQGSTANQQGVDINKDIVAITTSRELNSPAGAWAISLVSRRDTGGRTWAQRIRPMDYVEIRFAHDAKTRNKHDGSGDTSDLPIVMRGFVDRVTETVSMDQNGTPFRQTSVTGKDMGKLLLIRQLYFLPRASDQGLATAIAAGGQDARVFDELWVKLVETASGNLTLTPDKFLQNIHDYIYANTNPTTSGGQQPGGSAQNLVAGVPDLKFVTKDLDTCAIAPGMLQNFQGPIWNLLQGFQGAPVCELFVHDTKEGPELVWRWAPFKDKDGKLIDPVKDVAEPTVISLKEVMQYSVSTSDTNVFTYYYSYPQESIWNGMDPREAAMTVGGTGKEGENPLVRSELAKRYGFKQYELRFPLMKDLPNFTDKDFQDLSKNEWQKMGEKLSAWMDKAFSHSVNLEEGSMTLAGKETLDIGTYIKIKETREEFYVQGLRHDFVLNPPRFTTQLTLIRGLWSDPSPYPDDEGEAGLSGSGGSQQGGTIPDPGGEGGNGSE